MTWRQFQNLLVRVRIFNVGNAAIVFVVKCVGLSIGIAGLSALLLLQFQGNLVLLLITSYMGFSASLAYSAFYYNAYGVSKGLQSAKRELLKVPRTELDQALMSRRLLSVSPKGIWVGSLRTFERESFLIFFDFVIRAVMSIVLAFK